MIALPSHRRRRRVPFAAPVPARRTPVLGAVGRAAMRLAPLRRAAGARPDGSVLLGRCVACSLLGSLLFATATDGPRAAAALPLGAIVGWRLGGAIHERDARVATARARRELPLLIDRIALCVVAGMSVERALRTVATRADGLLGGALTYALRALDGGVPRARAYELLAERSGLDELRALATALARAERFGTSPSDTLVAQARDLRGRARAAAEAEARTAPVKLVFPLVFCFLPAFVVLTIAPIAISAIRTIGGI